MRTAARLALLLLLPLAVAASDPPGDTAPCDGSNGPGDPRIDLLDARGQAIENGGTIRWTMTFAQPIEVPDTEGTPMRVDVVIRDPVLPATSFDWYHELNRIVRFDAVPDPQVQIVLLAEKGSNVFDGAHVSGKTLEITIPSRLIVADSSLGPPVGRLRWSVIAQDEGTCDFLGEGRPTEALEGVAQVASSPSTIVTSAPVSDDGQGFPRIWLAAPVAAVVLLLVGLAMARGGREQSD